MSVEKREYTGKEVADAIKKACDDFDVPQEQLIIDILETGSTGIFGLIRKKAKIRVELKKAEDIKELEDMMPSKKIDEPPIAENKKESVSEKTPVKNEVEAKEESAEEVPQEIIAEVGEVLEKLLEVMTFPSDVTITSEGTEIFCSIEGEWNEYLTSQDGKTLDSIQYLLRKIIAKKTPQRIKLTVDAGNFREKRKESLKERAVELAEKVKQDGKTQVISALNPSGRRVVHMVLQEEKEIRSRSVGDGLFKKILIYKPGKNSRGDGRKKQGYKGKRGRGPRKNNSQAKNKS